MSSKSATVLVIFIIAVIAFCLASAFGTMVGPISILPNDTDDSGSILDNLSAITDGTGDTGDSYGYQDYNDYSSSSSSSSDDSNIETTVDNSQQEDNSVNSEQRDNGGDAKGSLSYEEPQEYDDGDIETTTD